MNKGPGINGNTAEILNGSFPVFGSYLHKSSLSEGIFPQCLKTVCAIPVHKRGF